MKAVIWLFLNFKSAVANARYLNAHYLSRFLQPLAFTLYFAHIISTSEIPTPGYSRRMVCEEISSL